MIPVEPHRQESVGLHILRRVKPTEAHPLEQEVPRGLLQEGPL